jgi:hypothetical protein
LKNSERIVGTFIYLNTIPGIADVSKYNFDGVQGEELAFLFWASICRWTLVASQRIQI